MQLYSDITTANAIGGTFAFLPTHKAKQKMQKSHQPTHHDRPMNGQTTYRQEGRTANKVLPQWGGVKYFYETFVGKRTVVLLLNICAKNPPLRQYPNRWLQ